MNTPRRPIIIGAVGLLAGCLDDSAGGDDSDTETMSSSNETDDSRSDDEIPYSDIDSSFHVEGEFVDKTDVAADFTVFASSDDRFDDVSAYDEFFAAIEELPESGRETGKHITGDTIRRDSDEGREIRTIVGELHEEMGNPKHPDDRASSVWGTHYIKHDGELIRVALQTPGTPE